MSATWQRHVTAAIKESSPADVWNCSVPRILNAWVTFITTGRTEQLVKIGSRSSSGHWEGYTLDYSLWFKSFKPCFISKEHVWTQISQSALQTVKNIEKQTENDDCAQRQSLTCGELTCQVNNLSSEAGRVGNESWYKLQTRKSCADARFSSPTC